MRNKLSLLIISLILLVTACYWPKRDPAPVYEISGKKWQEVKLRSYNMNYSRIVFKDTTYQRSAFDSLDYAQFKNDGTCWIGSGTYYVFYPAGALHSQPGQGGSAYFTFTKKGPIYILNTGITIQRDTVYLVKDTLRIHAAFDNDQYYMVTDAYYTR